MSVGVTPCLSLAIARLTTAGADNFAIWITHSPLPGGYVHHDTAWTVPLTQKWLAWQEMFSLQPVPHLPIINATDPSFLAPLNLTLSSPVESYSGRLMQELGIHLWQWLIDGSIRQSFAQSRGIAIGKSKPLRLRLEICDPNLISLPWEIMQPEAGQQAISLNPQILFSRTTSNVDPLPHQTPKNALNILLVLGEAVQPEKAGESRLEAQNPSASDRQFPKRDRGNLPTEDKLQLESEAAILAEVIEQSTQVEAAFPGFVTAVPTRVHTLIQPTPAELIKALDSGIYNIFFYAGHGMTAADGGLLFLHPEAAINGTELAQVLVRDRITLAVFNACWGAQPDCQGQQTLERSSLAEVLIHHGVPAVLAMRDSIADQEALSFIEAFTKALTQRMPIDQAVRVARQQLLTLYKFNQPAWTLPILYMHPEFAGELIPPIEEGITELPVMPLNLGQDPYPVAYLRSLGENEQIWRIHGGLMRVGRHQENDLVIQERWVSQRHAEIICRQTAASPERQYTYLLRDFSRFGTLLLCADEWQQIHHQEVPLQSGVQLKFGSPYGQILEFAIDS